ncbi:MAG: electron transfer flavoprotein subunit beta/FixA family protein [Deltaproteobacteria bacterium]|nr:electron transfer flavoprotein subunit beta/FixA family protein [Deltaproteobacteria bacterium]
MEFHTVVCIKSVVMNAPEGQVVRLPESSILNPFDLPAVEMALRIREERGGKITALSMGPDSTSLALYDCIALGADRAVLITDPALAGSDTLVTSTVLCKAINRLSEVDLVLFGTRTSDSDTGQVGPQTATLLGFPIITGVYEIENKERSLTVIRKSDEFAEKYEIGLPCAITVHPTAVQPRDARLFGIESAFREGKVEKIGLSDLGLPSGSVGEAGSPTRVLSTSPIKKERKCDFITGSVEDQAVKIVTYLKSKGFIG